MLGSPDAQDAVHRAHPDLPVTDRVGPGLLGQGLDQDVRVVVQNHEVQPDLGQQRRLPGPGQAKVDLGAVGRLTELAAETTDLAHSQSVYTAVDQDPDQLVQLLGSDNGGDQFHAIPPSASVALLLICRGDFTVTGTPRLL